MNPVFWFCSHNGNCYITCVLNVFKRTGFQGITLKICHSCTLKFQCVSDQTYISIHLYKCCQLKNYLWYWKKIAENSQNPKPISNCSPLTKATIFFDSSERYLPLADILQITFVFIYFRFQNYSLKWTFLAAFTLNILLVNWHSLFST